MRRVKKIHVTGEGESKELPAKNWNVIDGYVIFYSDYMRKTPLLSVRTDLVDTIVPIYEEEAA